MTLPNRRTLSLLAGLLVVAVVVAVFQWDARQRVHRLEEMMESQGRTLADLVGKERQFLDTLSETNISRVEDDYPLKG